MKTKNDILSVLVLAQEQVIHKRVKIRVVVDNLGLSVRVVEHAQGLLLDTGARWHYGHLWDWLEGTGFHVSQRGRRRSIFRRIRR